MILHTRDFSLADPPKKIAHCYRNKAKPQKRATCNTRRVNTTISYYRTTIALSNLSHWEHSGGLGSTRTVFCDLVGNIFRNLGIIGKLHR